MTETVGDQTVLGEAEVEEGSDGDGGCAELFLLFYEVGASDLESINSEVNSHNGQAQFGQGEIETYEADCTFVTESREHL